MNGKYTVESIIFLYIIELFALFFRGNDVIFDLSENLLIIRHNKGPSIKYVGIGNSNFHAGKK